MVVKCGQLSPDTAMKSTLWAQAAAIVREGESPRESASNTILMNTAG